MIHGRTLDHESSVPHDLSLLSRSSSPRRPSPRREGRQGRLLPVRLPGPRPLAGFEPRGSGGVWNAAEGGGEAGTGGESCEGGVSGPRVTSGTDSKQDFGTPKVFLDAVEKRFGPIAIDLAAHSGNKVASRYFAPPNFTRKIDLKQFCFAKEIEQTIGAELVRLGCLQEDVDRALVPVFVKLVDGSEEIVEITVPNTDPQAEAFDAFSQDWAAATKTGLGFLNCEFGDIAPWSRKSSEGGNIGLLTPASVGANWNREHVLGKADVYVLSGKNSRLCFDRKNVFPKDCQFAHYHPDALGLFALWDWRRDELLQVWWPDKRGAALDQARAAL